MHVVRSQPSTAVRPPADGLWATITHPHLTGHGQSARIAVSNAAACTATPAPQHASRRPARALSMSTMTTRSTPRCRSTSRAVAPSPPPQMNTRRGAGCSSSAGCTSSSWYTHSSASALCALPSSSSTCAPRARRAAPQSAAGARAGGNRGEVGQSHLNRNLQPALSCKLHSAPSRALTLERRRVSHVL